MLQRRWLFLFDFDHTIVHDNTDTYIWKLLPEKEKSLPPYFSKQLNRWNQFMRMTLQHYYHLGITVQQLRECLQEMDLTPGFDSLFEYIRSNKDLIECAIVSDSNTFFIESILEKKALKDIFSKVITNPVQIVDNAEVSLFPFHSHNCQTAKCPENMCKKVAILESFDLAQFERVCYFGDGTNDYCPASLLRKEDILFVRKGYSLEKIVAKQPLACQTKLFENGGECVAYLTAQNE